ncbi:hypothetical protein PSPO_a1683 [Pseudoalteromonas spongiae UST010723-006]|nr:hypothetical protein PSPO_a1683 [Pseudoalteromonas spongiae UST010723-006]
MSLVDLAHEIYKATPRPKRFGFAQNLDHKEQHPLNNFM